MLVSSGEPDKPDHASKPNQRDLLLTRILRPQEADAYPLCCGSVRRLNSEALYASCYFLEPKPSEKLERTRELQQVTPGVQALRGSRGSAHGAKAFLFEELHCA